MIYPWDWEWFSESDAVAGWPLHCELSSKPSGYVAGSDKMKCGSIPHPGDLGTTNATNHPAAQEAAATGKRRCVPLGFIGLFPCSEPPKDFPK